MFEARVQLPTSGSDKTAIWTIDEFAIEIAHIAAPAARRLPRDWRTSLGAYVLLGTVNPDGSYRAYVGSAFSASIGSRLPGQITSRPWVKQAFAIRRTTTTGFTAAHAVYLERTLFEMTTHTDSCRLTNANTPQRMPVTVAERRWLRAALDPLSAMLATHGFSLNTHHARGDLDGSVTVADLVTAGLLVPGDRLFPRWKPAGISPAVVTRQGDLLWQGHTYSGTQPSAPARLSRGGRKTNGWQYYVLHRGDQRTPLEDLRTRYRDLMTTAA